MVDGKKSLYSWDAEDYSRSSSQQKKWGRELISKISLRGDERILDIGCGDGNLTAELARRVPGGFVLGIDNSEEMIGFARLSHPRDLYPNLAWAVTDAAAMDFKEQFDLAFSNAVLHWIPNQKSVLEGIERALKPGGKALLQMGGRGNAAQVVESLVKVVGSERWRDHFCELSFTYSFYGPEEYGAWLAEVGLYPLRVELVHKDMVHEGREGLAAWIRTTWLPFTQCVPESFRDAFIYEVVDAYLEKHPPDGEGMAHVEAIRLEVEAKKPH